MRGLVLAVPALVVGALVFALAALSGPRWTEREIALVRSLTLDALPPLPADPSNRVADDSLAADLGRAFFFDARFSANGEVSCATCHLVAREKSPSRQAACNEAGSGR